MQIYKKKRKSKKNFQKYCHIKKKCIFAASKQAEVAQLVEHNLAKVGVASSSLVFRSIHRDAMLRLFLFIPPNSQKLMAKSQGQQLTANSSKIL